MLDLKTAKLTYEALEQWAEALESEVYKANRAAKMLRRQNEYLTALHETSLGLIDHLDKEELLEAVLQRAAKLTGTEHGNCIRAFCFHRGFPFLCHHIESFIPGYRFKVTLLVKLAILLSQ